MGKSSAIHRYHDVGTPPNENNTAKYGEPKRSLFTSTKVLSLKHKIEIVDEENRPAYYAETKFPSLHDKTTVYDANGNQISFIEKKLLSFRQAHTIVMNNGETFEITNELFHIIKTIINIKGLNWKVIGNILALNFEMYDQDGNIVAIISQKAISLHDKYCIDIYQPEYEKIVVTVLVTIQHMIRDKENNVANSGSNSN